MSKGKAKGFCEDEHDTLWFEDRVYVPNDPEIRKLILQDAHDSPYSIHPESILQIQIHLGISWVN